MVLLIVLFALSSVDPQPKVTKDDWVFRWEPVDGTIFHIHIDHHDTPKFQWHSVRILDSGGEKLHADDQSWFISGIEMPIAGKTSRSIFLAEWSAGAHNVEIIPYYWTGKELKVAPTVGADGEYFWLQDVTDDGWPELILWTQVETPRKSIANWPFFASAYAWRGDHFEYIGRAPAEKLKSAARKLFQ